MQKVTGINPVIYSDYPDADVIRVGDTYFMVSTTMHFMPGCVILRSYDLLHWEIASYVYERLEETPGQCLADNKGVYGKGMWAASIRYYEGTFYVCFVANDTGKTYLYRATDINGPWKRNYIEGFFHDSSLLFDDDGRVYIALDYFDASINRVSAWTVGFRNVQKALLMALLEPSEALGALQDANNWTELMVRAEEAKTLPFGDVWEEYCKVCGAPADGEWFSDVLEYEKNVMLKRG